MGVKVMSKENKKTKKRCFLCQSEMEKHFCDCDLCPIEYECFECGYYE